MKRNQDASAFLMILAAFGIIGITGRERPKTYAAPSEIAPVKTSTYR